MQLNMNTFHVSMKVFHISIKNNSVCFSSLDGIVLMPIIIVGNSCADLESILKSIIPIRMVCYDVGGRSFFPAVVIGAVAIAYNIVISGRSSGCLLLPLSAVRYPGGPREGREKDPAL